jgi:hypothetical protein
MFDLIISIKQQLREDFHFICLPKCWLQLRIPTASFVTEVLLVFLRLGANAEVVPNNQDVTKYFLHVTLTH